MEHLIEDAEDDHDAYHIGTPLADEISRLAVECTKDNAGVSLVFNWGFQRLLRRLRNTVWDDYTLMPQGLLILFFLCNADIGFIREHFKYNCNCQPVHPCTYPVHDCWPNLRLLMLSWSGSWNDELIAYVVTNHLETFFYGGFICGFTWGPNAKNVLTCLSALHGNSGDLGEEYLRCRELTA